MSDSKESTDFAHNLWLFMFCLFRLYCVMPKRVLNMLACWKGRFWLTL